MQALNNHMAKARQQCDSCGISIRHGFPLLDRRLFCSHPRRWRDRTVCLPVFEELTEREKRAAKRKGTTMQESP